MNEHIAVVGTGAIGAMMGGYLTKAGYNVTMLSIARPEQAKLLAERGLTLEGFGPGFHVPVRTAYLPALEEAEKFDLMFLTMKSNYLEQSLPALIGHMTADGILCPMQNGIPDSILERYVSPDHIVTCVTFAGGAQIEPGRFMNHDGEFFVGRRDGAVTPSVTRTAEVIQCVRPTTVSDHIRSVQWDKLSRVCLSVPTACLSGLFLGDVFLHPDTQRLFAALALELFSVAEADGCPRLTVEEKTRDTWRAILEGTQTGLEHSGQLRPWPSGIVDAYTSDIRKGLPLEIEYTNGVVVALGKTYGIPILTNAAVLDAVHQVEKEPASAGLELLHSLIARLDQ